VPRRVGDDELAAAGRKVAVGHVDRDALFTLGLQAVGEQRKVEGWCALGPRCAGRTLLERVDLVGEDGPRIEQQAADQRTLAVVDRTGGQEAQRTVVGCLRKIVGSGSVRVGRIDGGGRRSSGKKRRGDHQK